MSAARPAGSQAAAKKTLSLEDWSRTISSIMKPVVEGGLFSAQSLAAIKAFEQRESLSIFSSLASKPSSAGDAKIAADIENQVQSYASFIGTLLSIGVNLDNLKQKISIESYKALAKFFEDQILILQNDTTAKIDAAKNALQNFSKELDRWVNMSSRIWPLNSGTLSDELSNTAKSVQDAKFVPQPSKFDDLSKLQAYVQIYIINGGHKHAESTFNKLSPGIQAAIKDETGIKGNRLFNAAKNVGDRMFAYIGSRNDLVVIANKLRNDLAPGGEYTKLRVYFVYAMKALARIKPELAYQILHPNDKDAKQMPVGKDLLTAVNHTAAEKFYDEQYAKKTAGAAPAAPAPSMAAKK